MSADTWITIVSILFGSSVVVNIIQLLSNRFRFDRRADVIRSWKEESLIADEFEDAAAQELTQDRSDRAKSKIAFGHAVRADLNRRIAGEIVPSGTWVQLTGYLLALVIMLIGVVVVAIAATQISIGDTSNFRLGIPGLTIFAIGSLLYWYTNSLEVGRATARKIVVSILNNRPDLRSHIVSYEDGHAKLFARRRLGRFHRTAFGLDIASNLESFLDKTVTEEDFDSSAQKLKLNR